MATLQKTTRLISRRPLQILRLTNSFSTVRPISMDSCATIYPKPAPQPYVSSRLPLTNHHKHGAKSTSRSLSSSAPAQKPESSVRTPPDSNPSKPTRDSQLIDAIGNGVLVLWVLGTLTLAIRNHELKGQSKADARELRQEKESFNERINQENERSNQEKEEFRLEKERYKQLIEKWNQEREERNQQISQLMEITGRTLERQCQVLLQDKTSERDDEIYQCMEKMGGALDRQCQVLLQNKKTQKPWIC